MAAERTGGKRKYLGSLRHSAKILGVTHDFEQFVVEQFFFFSFLFFFFWPSRTAHGILVPRPGIEPLPPAVEAPSLNHRTAREVPANFYLWQMTLAFHTLH